MSISQNAPYKTIEKLFYTYDDPEDAFDIPMLFSTTGQLDFFLGGVACVIDRYFDDGVALVGLRFNPCKIYNGTRIDPFLLIKKLDTLLTSLEKKADNKYGGSHRVEFIFSFNQANHSEKKAWILQTMKEAIKQKVNKARHGINRITGIDLSGRETDRTKRSNWGALCQLVETAKRSGVDLMLVCHAGDRWNITNNYNNHFEKHLSYMQDALSIKNLSRVGHANLLWPTYKIIRDPNNHSQQIFVPTNQQEKERIEEILSSIKEKNIAITTLPKAEFATIQRMKKHPFYHWKKRAH